MASKNHVHHISLALIFFFGFWAFQAASHNINEMSMTERHEQWMAQYGKVCKDSLEKEMRSKIFKDNVEYIEAFNNAGNKPYKLGINQFADLTMPSSVDWRTQGAVTPIKNQGQCGCCWAFSAVAAMGGITKLKIGKLVSLSEQELVDCDTNGVDQGCEEGLMDDAFKFIIQNKGLTTEANYPYQGTDGTCNANKETNSAATIKGYEDVPANSEEALQKAVANQPVSVAIDASGSDFQFYKSGVFTGSCGTQLDHGVTAVSYGVADDGTKYWLVKNSWGTEWGEEGYLRMQRDVTAAEGLCGNVRLFPRFYNNAHAYELQCHVIPGTTNIFHLNLYTF